MKTAFDHQRVAEPHPRERDGASRRPAATALPRDAVLQLQRSHGNAHVARLMRQLLRNEDERDSSGPRLLDFRQRRGISIEDIETTSEFKAYMDPRMRWQWEFHATREEAWSACFWIWYALRQGKTVDWNTEARTYLLAARREAADMRKRLPDAPTADSPKPPESAETPPAETPIEGVEHYRIELKAWIPHARVADPEDPPTGDDTYYRGDAHAGFDGSHRVLNWLEFDSDGFTITKLTGGDDYGETHRDYYEAGEIVKSDTGRATEATSRTLKSDYELDMSIASANPLVRVWAPDIDSSLHIAVVGGALVLRWKTDGFPSHGIRVYRDGKVVETLVVNDASAVKVEGVEGLVQIAAGLTRWERNGHFFVMPARTPPNPPPGE
jgi:hypothetical protein